MKMKITFDGGKKVNAEFKDFIVKTDQNPKSGGDGSAPEPFQYFLSSIGTCAGVYILEFCSSRNIPTNDIEIYQSLVYDTVLKRIAKIKLEIKVPRDFPPKYHNALVKAVNSCAVKKTVQDPPAFETFTSVQD